MSTIIFLLLAAGIAAFLYVRYRVAPKVELPAIQVLIDGVETDLPFKNQAIILHYYASWCGPCMREMSLVNAAQQQLKEDGIQIIGLTDDPEMTIEKVKQRYNLQFPVYQLSGTLKDEGVHSIPTTIVLNKAGETAYSHVGELKWDQPFITDIKDKINN